MLQLPYVDVVWSSRYDQYQFLFQHQSCGKGLVMLTNSTNPNGFLCINTYYQNLLMVNFIIMINLGFFFCPDCNEFHLLWGRGTKDEWDQFIFQLGQNTMQAGTGSVIPKDLDENVVNTMNEAITKIVHQFIKKQSMTTEIELTRPERCLLQKVYAIHVRWLAQHDAQRQVSVRQYENVIYLRYLKHAHDVYGLLC